MLKFKKLQGKWDNQIIKYSFLNKQDANQASELVTKIFCERQPLCSHLGVSYKQFKYFADYLLLNQRLSKTLIAKSQKTNKIIGISLNESADDPFQIQPQMGQKLKIVMQFLDMMSTNFIKQFSSPKKSLFNLLLVGTDQKYVGSGVATDLMKNSAILAKELGYKYLVVELTSPGTQHIWINKLKFPIQKQYLLNHETQYGSKFVGCKLNDKVIMGYKDLQELVIQWENKIQ